MSQLIDARFQLASGYVRGNTSALPQDVQLQLYGLFKRITTGGPPEASSKPGVWDIVATPPSRTCTGFVAVPDVLLTLAPGIDDGSCGNGESYVAASGASGYPYFGCMSATQADLDFVQTGTWVPPIGCVTGLSASFSQLVFDTTDHFTGRYTACDQ